MDWLIVNITDPLLLWNNHDGWVDDDSDYDTFSDEEKASYNLPMDGRWELVSDHTFRAL